MTACILQSYRPRLLHQNRKLLPLACARTCPCHSLHSTAINRAPYQGSTLTEDRCYPAQVGAWGNCSQPCGTGVANRSVICIDGRGATVNSTLCPGLQPEHQAYCLNKECDFCSTTDCSKQVSIHCCHKLPYLSGASSS